MDETEAAEASPDSLPDASLEAPSDTPPAGDDPGNGSPEVRTAHYLLQPCRNTAAFELKPRRKGGELDLNEARETLLGLGFRMVTDARVLLILERECAINLWPSGRILIRTLDQALARRLADTLVATLFPH